MPPNATVEKPGLAGSGHGQLVMVGSVFRSEDSLAG